MSRPDSVLINWQKTSLSSLRSGRFGILHLENNVCDKNPLKKRVCDSTRVRTPSNQRRGASGHLFSGKQMKIQTNTVYEDEDFLRSGKSFWGRPTDFTS